MKNLTHIFSITNRSTLTRSALLLACLSSSLLTNVAHAHGVQGGGLINGMMHPVFGPDHLLAMVAVGALSVQMGGRAIWAVPASFVALMFCGGVWGMMKMPFPVVETGIALSVLVLGVAIAFDKKMPTIWSMLCVGFFALFHGYAHGMEMPYLAQPALYAVGFILATACLHVVGIVIGEVAKKIKNGDSLLRYTGAGVAGIGFAILTGI